MLNYTIDAAVDSTRPGWQSLQVERTSSGSGSIIHAHLLRDIFQYVSGMEAKDTANEFQRFADQWRRETRYLSSDHDIAMNPAYQSIIGMGDRAITLILRDLQQKAEPDHWFWALTMITHENPVSPEEAGDIGRMRERWLDWGRRGGYIRDRLTGYAY